MSEAIREIAVGLGAGVMVGAVIGSVVGVVLVLIATAKPYQPKKPEGME